MKEVETKGLLLSYWIHAGYEGREEDEFCLDTTFKFHFDDDFGRFLRGGKPIIRSSYFPLEEVIHGGHANVDDVFMEQVNFVVYHFKNYSLRRRFLTNVQKLASRKKLDLLNIYSDVKRLFKEKENYKGATKDSVVEVYKYLYSKEELELQKKISNNYFEHCLASNGFPKYHCQNGNLTLDFYLDTKLMQQEIDRIMR